MIELALLACLLSADPIVTGIQPGIDFVSIITHAFTSIETCANHARGMHESENHTSQ